jgi:lipid-A-disaccharide synthase
MNNRQKRVLMVAGESSGDLHGSSLARALFRLDPGVKIYGVGGDKLKAAGMETTFNSADLAVVGITEVVKKFRAIFKIFRWLKASLKQNQPDLLILIDYPDFNLRLAKAAKKRGTPVFYYISPQVWAWRKRRVRKIVRLVDRMAVIFPFEVPYYQRENVDVKFVGHPLVEAVKSRFSKEDALHKFGLDPSKETIGLLPGSRKNEIFSLLPEMLGAAEIISSNSPNIQFILPLAPACEEDDILGIVNRYDVKLKIVKDYYYEAIDVSDFIIVASGTATLEVALLNTPMLIIYKTSLLTYLIGRILIKVKDIGLVNIVAGRRIVPELIQSQVTPGRISREALKFIRNDNLISEMERNLREVRKKLGGTGAAEKVAKMAYQMMREKGD